MAIDPLRHFPGYALRRASNASLSDLSPKLAELDLRVTDASVLLAIKHNPQIKQTEIGRMLSIASANVAPIVGRLDERGLLNRIRVDGRSHGLELTEKGEELAKSAMVIVEAHEASLIAKIPADMRDTFVEILNGLWGDDH